MPRFMFGVAGAAIVAAALAACSSNSNSPSPGTPTASAGAGQAKVTVNHQDQNDLGAITCDLSDYAAEITIERNHLPLAYVKMTQQQGNAREVQGLSLKYIKGANLRTEFLAYNVSDWAATGPDPPAPPTVEEKVRATRSPATPGTAMTTTFPLRLTWPAHSQRVDADRPIRPSTNPPGRIEGPLNAIAAARGLHDLRTPVQERCLAGDVTNVVAAATRVAQLSRKIHVCIAMFVCYVDLDADRVISWP